MRQVSEAHVFEQLRLLGAREDSIVLQTRRRTNVPNCVGDAAVPSQIIAKFDRLTKQRTFWQIRRSPTGVYNCVGHVWASRRTGVFESLDSLVVQIRDDDGYRVLDTRREWPVSGDIVTYWEATGPYRNFLHIGIVEMRPGPAPESPKIPWVLSKLDATSGEVLHHYQDVPYENVFPNFAIEFWTERPTL